MASSSKPLISCFLLVLLFILACSPYCLGARSMPHNELAVKSWTGNTIRRQRFDFSKFSHAGLGSQINGMSELKRYLHRFGYLAPRADGSDFDDNFDPELESAVTKYQRRLGLPPTGRIDPDTVASLMTPRCGVRDVHNHEHESSSSAKTSLFHVTRKYKFIDGKPIWNLEKPMTLTYAFYPGFTTKSLSQDEIRVALAKAFAKWAKVIPVKFEEISDVFSAQVHIGFFKGYHGDKAPFDGTWGVLAHSEPYPSGEFHLDADENWAVDFTTNPDPENAFDLESIAIHEIGHVLGLDHSSARESIMYPSADPMTKKVDLSMDDVEGIQTLYGPNPDFRFSTSPPPPAPPQSAADGSDPDYENPNPDYENSNPDYEMGLAPLQSASAGIWRRPVRISLWITALVVALYRIMA